MHLYTDACVSEDSMAGWGIFSYDEDRATSFGQYPCQPDVEDRIPYASRSGYDTGKLDLFPISVALEYIEKKGINKVYEIYTCNAMVKGVIDGTWEGSYPHSWDQLLVKIRSFLNKIWERGDIVQIGLRDRTYSGSKNAHRLAKQGAGVPEGSSKYDFTPCGAHVLEYLPQSL